MRSTFLTATTLPRTLFAMVALAMPGASALAHLLPDDAGMARQVEHQLIAPHHMPLTFFIAWIAVLAMAAAWRRLAADRGRNAPARGIRG